MADEAVRPEPPRPYDKAARQAERARLARLSRLPFLYDYSLRGRREAVLTNLLAGALVLLVVLVPTKLVSGRWLPAGVGLLVLAAAFALQGANRYLNARAGRR